MSVPTHLDASTPWRFRVRRTVIACAALSVALGAGSCGNLPGAKAEPKAWAKDVCGAIVPWSTDMTKTLGDFQDDIDENADPAKVKADLDKALGASVTSTDKAIKGVDDAGVPDVSNGEKVAKDFRGSLVETKSAFEKARKGVQALATGDKPAFFEKLAGVMTQLGKDVSRSGKKLDKISSPELDKAFDSEPACKTE